MTAVLERGEAADGAAPRAISRAWDDPPVLVSLAVIVLAAVWLGTLERPGPPGDTSPEAGFARDMLVHHAQAVEMAELVRLRTQDPAVRALATDIALTQQAQIGQVRGWLDVWGLPVTGRRPAMARMGHPTAGLMPRMATPAQVHGRTPAGGSENGLPVPAGAGADGPGVVPHLSDAPIYRSHERFPKFWGSGRERAVPGTRGHTDGLTSVQLVR